MNTLFSFISVALLIPTIAVLIRRLHDTGRSALYLLWGLVPIVGWIFLFLALVKPSTPGNNQYGANPLGIYDANAYQSQQYLPTMAGQHQLPAPNAFPG